MIITKSNFIQRFKRLHSLRLHMSLLLLATVFSGLLATRILLALGLKNVAMRYPLAVLFAYVVFIVGVKLWLKYVVPLQPVREKTAADSFDVLTNISGSGSSGGHSSAGGGWFRGGGGNFGGAGASGSFGEVDAVVAEGGSGVLSAAADTGGGVAEAAGSAAGEAVSGLDLDKGWLVVLALAAILALIFGAGIYLIYEAPVILSDAAFNVFLAAGLGRGTRRLQRRDWMGSVFRATWLPLTVTLLLSFLAGYLMHQFFPEVTRLSELWNR